jgi:hypothetical protein
LFLSKDTVFAFPIWRFVIVYCQSLVEMGKASDVEGGKSVLE